jgi:PEP-CTERM motif-containing protein
VSRQSVARAFFCLVAAALGSPPAHAVVVGIDEFSVTRNGGLFFSDTFADGLVPPSGPSGSATYNVSGTILGTAESGGLLLLDSANGELSANADGDPRLSVRVRLLSNIDQTNLSAGLKSDDTLSLSGIFTLTTPSGPDVSQYAIRFNDATGEGAHQLVQLQVRFNPNSGAPEIRYLQQDFDASTITTLGSAAFAPPAGADRIRLTISRPSLLNDDFFGAYSYLSGGSVIAGAGGSFATAGQMFEGENFVRAEFNVSEAIPEPGTLALLVVGLAGIAVTRVRQLR